MRIWIYSLFQFQPPWNFHNLFGGPHLHTPQRASHAITTCPYKYKIYSNFGNIHNSERERERCSRCKRRRRSGAGWIQATLSPLMRPISTRSSASRLSSTSPPIFTIGKTEFALCVCLLKAFHFIRFWRDIGFSWFQ